MTEKKQGLFAWLPICDARCLALMIRVLWIFLPAYAIYQYYLFQLQYTKWDLLMFTGVVSLILGLRLASQASNKFNKAIERLEYRDAFKFGGIGREGLYAYIRKNGDQWARLIGLAVAVAIAVTFILAFTGRFDLPRVFFVFGATLAAYMAGNYLGRLASYGRLGRYLKVLDIDVKVDPLHVDGVGGLKPIGDYYFFQAMLVAIPAVFLALWWFLFPIWPRDYSYWEQEYLALMGVALMLEVAAFVLPLWSFHVIMLEQKSSLQTDADRLGKEIAELQQVLNSNSAEDEKAKAVSSIKEKTEYYWAIENMTTWPVDVKTRHQFRFNNILLFIPIMGDVAKREIPWAKIYDLFKGVA